VNRRAFLARAGAAGLGLAALARGPQAARAAASPYPDWVAPSPKPPKRGGVLTRASAWDPPVLDPRLTNSVGLFQIAALTSNRLVRHPYSDDATGTSDLTLKGDLATSWEGSADSRVWTFKLRQGVKWHNVPPLNGRELVAADIKYCFEAYAKEGVQAFTFREIEGMETPDKYTVRVHLRSPNTMFPQILAEPVAVVFPREVLEQDGDLKKRLVGTGPFILKEHTRKVRVVLARNPDYFEKGMPYVDEYHILSTPDAATRLAAFRAGQNDILFVASPGEVETVRKTTPAAVAQEYKTVQTVFGLALAQDRPPFTTRRSTGATWRASGTAWPGASRRATP
jgi:peptide/nickel transport system substrate-binding protein